MAYVKEYVCLCNGEVGTLTVKLQEVEFRSELIWFFVIHGEHCGNHQ